MSQLGRGAVKLSRPQPPKRTQLQSAGDADQTQTSTSTASSYAEPNQLRRIPQAHSPTSPFSTRIQESFGEPEVPLTEESDTESGGCTKAKRRRKNKEIENKECADGATDLTPENPKGKSREQGVASQEADTADVEECLLGDYTDGEEEEREEKEGEEEEEEEGDGDGIENMSQLGAGTAKVKFKTVKQHSYKLVDKDTTKLAKHVVGCYQKPQEETVSQLQLPQGTQLHSTKVHPQQHKGTQLHVDPQQTSSYTTATCAEPQTSPRRTKKQLSTSPLLPNMPSIQESVVSEIQSLGVPLTDASPVGTQYNFIQVQQQFGEVTVKGAKNLSIGGTQNLGTPRTGQEEEEEKPLSTVQKIRKRTSSRIQSWTQNIVETEGLQQVIDRIQRGATWVTIKGRPGEGKSTVAYMTLKDLHSKGRQVFQVVSPDEFNEVIMACPHPVIMLDDIFGDLEFDGAEWAKWRPSLRPILDAKDMDNLHSTVNVVEVAGTSEGTRGEPKQPKKTGPPKMGPIIILVGRDYVLKSSLTDLGRMADYITNIRHMVEISTQRNTEEKRKIWNVNAQRKKIDFNETIVSKILQADCPHGFPHVCKMFVTEYEKEKNLIPVESFFNKPLGFLKQTLHKFLADSIKCDLFKAMAQRDGQISEQEMEESNPGYDCKSAANDLVGSYLKKEDDIYTFDHPSIYDSVALILIRNHTCFVIENCTLSFIHQRLRLIPSTRSANDASVDTDLVAYIPQSFAVQLAVRFAAEIERRNLLHVLSHQACCDAEFIDKLMAVLKTHCHASFPDMLSLTDKSSQQSFCELLSSNKSQHFLKYIMMKENIQFTENGIKEILLGVCRNAAGNVLTYMNEHMHCDIDTRYGLDHQTPIMIAAGTKNSSFVEQILSLNPDLNAADRRDKSVLHYICENGLTSAVEYVIDKGVELNVQMAFQQMPLYLAIQNGHTEVVKLLLKRGCDSDNHKGLLCAIGSDMIDMVTLFLDRGAHVERNDIFVACERGNPDVVKKLFENSATRNKKSFDRHTFLHKAVEWGYKQRVDVLLKAGADANVQNQAGDKPLHTAANFGFLECADVLLTAGADVNVQNTAGDTPLHRAVISQSKQFVDELLKAGADVNVQNTAGDTPLHRAVISQSKQFVDELLKAGADVNVQNTAGDTPLHRAVISQSKQFVDELLKAGADVNAQNKKGDTPLHRAVISQSKQFVDELLKAGADVNAQNKEGDTPLHTATLHCSTKCINVLLKAGADVNAQNKEGDTPLQRAIISQSKESVDVLLNTGADVNIQNTTGGTPLHRAAAHLSDESVDVLVKAGADVNAQNKEGDTPLHIATLHPSIKCVDVLVKAGADVNAQNKEGDTPLHTATLHCSTKCINVLLKAGADVNAKNTAGGTSLHRAIISQSTECVDVFMKAGADANVQNNTGDTPLHLVTKTLSKVCDGVLLEVRADVNKLNETGETPLHTASAHWPKECVDVLMNSGADVNAQNNAGDTPLHEAIISQSKESVDVLLNTGADVNIQNTTGDTPLHRAAAHLSDESVDVLVKAGADVNLQNKTGDTPLHIATLHRSIKCVDVLLKAGGDVTVQNKEGDTPLHIATLRPSFKCVDMLVKAGADVNAQNKEGDTPLQRAIISQIKECVDVLLNSGADVNIQNTTGDTPLHMAATSRSKESVDVLVKAGADVNVQNKTGDTPLRGAIISQSKECFEVLLKAGADVKVQNNAGNTPLHIAMLHRSFKCVGDLLKGGGDVNVQNNAGDTPLHISAAHLSAEGVEVLVKTGADVNAQNTTGDTPLHTAAASRSKGRVDQLVKAGADVNVQNNAGDTPLHTAAASRSKGCVEELVKAGADVNVQNNAGDTPLPSGATCWPEEWDDELVKAQADLLFRRRRRKQKCVVI
ncbi:uncharacterized protein LOC124149842 isoform X2 [Haliotis rufescens]|nr:uncharacterized protein LOC124149842 isoform X2 [Haliotis rufescens]